MSTKILTWAQGLYTAGLALGILFIIPTPWFPLQLGKITLVALCMLAAAIVFALSPEGRSFLRGRTIWMLALMGLIPLVYLVSFLTSIDRSIGITGFGIENDTVLFVTLAYLVFALGLGLFRTASSARLLLIGVMGAAAITGIVQFLVIVFGTSIFPTIFADHSVNLIGKWNDLGLLIGFLFVLVLLAWEALELSMRRRILLGILGVVALLLLAIIHFPFVWSALLVYGITLALWGYLSRRQTAQEGGVEGMSTLARVRWVPVGVAVLSGILLLWGAAVNTNLTSVFPVSSLEVRPSFSSTIDIIKASHGSSPTQFLLGTGPQTFGEDWLQHKPQSVNQSPFWNLDFNVGFSTFVTALGSVGALGALVWLIPLMLSLVALLAAVRARDMMMPRERILTQALGIGALYFWAATLLYVPSEIILLLAFALTGVLCGILFTRMPTQAGVMPETPQSPFMRWGSVAALAAVIILAAWSSIATSRRFLAEAYTNQGIAVLQNNHPDDALAFATKAQHIEENVDDLRLASDAGFIKLQTLAQATQHPSQDQINTFLAISKQTITQGQVATTKAPQDYRGYLSLGKTYDLLASLGIPGAYQGAQNAYHAAQSRNPVSPQIPLLLARLEAGQNNIPGIQTNLTQALTLKPDYTDAILFLVQLDVAAHDIPSAITAAKAAVQSAPGVPSIWFELGLLYYSANDTANAIPVLEQAVKIQSDYANAKYFLGLSYAAQGKTQDAIAQFQDLKKTNPDNQEVELILGNLLAGKQPFAGAQPPVTATPQNRTQAPISQ